MKDVHFLSRIFQVRDIHFQKVIVRKVISDSKVPAKRNAELYPGSELISLRRKRKPFKKSYFFLVKKNWHFQPAYLIGITSSIATCLESYYFKEHLIVPNFGDRIFKIVDFKFGNFLIF